MECSEIYSEIYDALLSNASNVYCDSIHREDGKFKKIKVIDFRYDEESNFGQEFWYWYDPYDKEYGLEEWQQDLLEISLHLDKLPDKMLIHARWWTEWVEYDILEIDDKQVIVLDDNGKFDVNKNKYIDK